MIKYNDTVTNQETGEIIDLEAFLQRAEKNKKLRPKFLEKINHQATKEINIRKILKASQAQSHATGMATTVGGETGVGSDVAATTALHAAPTTAKPGQTGSAGTSAPLPG